MFRRETIQHFSLLQHIILKCIIIFERFDIGLYKTFEPFVSLLFHHSVLHSLSCPLFLHLISLSFHSISLSLSLHHVYLIQSFSNFFVPGSFTCTEFLWPILISMNEWFTCIQRNEQKKHTYYLNAHEKSWIRIISI